MTKTAAVALNKMSGLLATKGHAVQPAEGMVADNDQRPFFGDLVFQVIFKRKAHGKRPQGGRCELLRTEKLGRQRIEDGQHTFYFKRMRKDKSQKRRHVANGIGNKAQIKGAGGRAGGKPGFKGGRHFGGKTALGLLTSWAFLP